MSISKKNYQEATDDETNEINESQRNAMDAAHGDDEIEIAKNEAKRLNDMDTFTPRDGDLGDESTDFDDLPSDTKKHHNYYDPSASTGGKELDTEQTDGMHIAEAGEAGIAFGEDNYVDEDGKIEKAEEKKDKSKK